MSNNSVILAGQDYPFLNLFWTMVWFFLWVLLLFFLFVIVVDIFRNHALSGLARAGWLLCVIVVPIIGPSAYVIVRRTKTARRDARAMPPPAGRRMSMADELASLALLRDQGVLTESEFTSQRAKVLA
jgi:hypothetical protein